ncbi:MAG TPA: alpha/beta hydrolase [Kofleriaceae bacterium]|jgi:acetyl esterase
MRSAVRAAMGTGWFVRLVARKRSGGNDAELDRQVAAALEFQRIARMPALDSMEPVAAREYAEEGMSPLELEPESMAEVIDTRVGSPALPVRIFVPHDATPHWIVYFHGGGGVIGSIRGSEPVTRYLAARTRCTVASVEYRLGPEDRHPAAIDDAHAAFRALAARVPAGGRIAVAGDSFGGFLSVHVDHRTRRAHERGPDLQVLLYPIVDLTLTSPSIERFAAGYLLTESMMHWFRDNYLKPSDDPRDGSPQFWPDAELAGAAPAVVVTAGFDPLVVEGDAWARRLEAAHVRVRHRCERSLVHGFLSLAGAIDEARAATDRICADIVELLDT